MIETSQLRIGLGAERVLAVDNLALGTGLHLLEGPNGSGKTTLLMALAGLTPIVSGSIFVDGTDVSQMLPSERSQLGIRYLPQNSALFGQLSIEENVELIQKSIRGWTKQRPASDLKELFSTLPELGAVVRNQERLAKSLSGGERQLASLWLTLFGRHQVLLLDEPLSLLNPSVLPSLIDAIRRAADEAIVVVSDHSGSMDKSLCSSVLSMGEATRIA